MEFVIAEAQRWSHLCYKLSVLFFNHWYLSTLIFCLSFLSLVPFLLPLPLSGFRLSMASFLKIVLCFPALSLALQILLIVLGLSRWSASKALGDKILTAFSSTLWRRTFVLEAPWWHTGNSSLIKRLANCWLNYCTERMKWVCKKRQFGEFFFFSLKHSYKQVLENVLLLLMPLSSTIQLSFN